VRYADDMILLAQDELDKGIALLGHYLERLGLTLNKEKTHKLSMEEGGKPYEGKPHVRFDEGSIG